MGCIASAVRVGTWGERSTVRKVAWSPERARTGRRSSARRRPHVREAALPDPLDVHPLRAQEPTEPRERPPAPAQTPRSRAIASSQRRRMTSVCLEARSNRCRSGRRGDRPRGRQHVVAPAAVGLGFADSAHVVEVEQFLRARPRALTTSSGARKSALLRWCARGSPTLPIRPAQSSRKNATSPLRACIDFASALHLHTHEFACS